MTALLKIQAAMRQWRTNPLLVREIRRSKKPTLRTAFNAGIVLSIVAGLLILAFAVKGAERDYLNVILALYAFVAISIPPFMAYTAAGLTDDDARFDLLHITTLLNSRLVEGYILSTLFRCRWLLAPLLSFAPFVLIATIYVGNSFASCFPENPYHISVCRIPLALPDVLLTLATFSAVALNLFGVGLLAVTLGVLFAVWWRIRFLASLVATILAMILVVMLLFNAVSFYDADLPLQRHLFMLPFVYLLSWIVFLTARRVIRR